MANMLHFFVIMCSANGIVHAIDLACRFFTSLFFCHDKLTFFIAISNLHSSSWQFYFHIHGNFRLHRSPQMYIYVAWQVVWQLCMYVSFSLLFLSCQIVFTNSLPSLQFFWDFFGLLPCSGANCLGLFHFLFKLVL